MELSTKSAGTLLKESEEDLQTVFRSIEQVARANQRKVLEAFWHERVAESDFNGSTGYGLDDEGRDKLERIYARVFEAQAALVRPQIFSGTHALRLGLFGVLRPGQNVVFATGNPYDTLEAVVGLRQAVGSLSEWGVSHKVVPMSVDGSLDLEAVVQAIDSQTKVVMFQRSRGYSDRPALTIHQLETAFRRIRPLYPDVVLAVDNCYGEFVEELEPTAVGADLAMGSLIKNPGGGIATTGGYLVGKQEWIEQAAAQLTAPGIGREAAPTHDFLRSFYQGLFLAPHVVSQALKGSVLAARVFEKLGLTVSPRWNEPRSDLILSVDFEDEKRLLNFCRSVQNSAPVDSYVVPQAAPMAGYADPVVMAAGAFVQGGSLELSADAPLRPPYRGYFQGGLTYEHVYVALEKVVSSILE
ncbi:methionine gamma-lyase family protein [Alicyclobacillus tolerans]|uniref:methionine gamma-lyase family protein n=1 Tax=Alicyclobacillus tolerans TaxID=90970 RepID=UPI001F254865|nr:methionine gamma-lyase family protein [Alicyclobacillus tolerans]MCF8566960.1 methionine gamma-lyase family protein [Alicyclobacillus tolerans]